MSLLCCKARLSASARDSGWRTQAGRLVLEPDGLLVATSAEFATMALAMSAAQGMPVLNHIPKSHSTIFYDSHRSAPESLHQLRKAIPGQNGGNRKQSLNGT